MVVGNGNGLSIITSSELVCKVRNVPVSSSAFYAITLGTYQPTYLCMHVPSRYRIGIIKGIEGESQYVVIIERQSKKAECKQTVGISIWNNYCILNFHPSRLCHGGVLISKRRDYRRS